MKAVRIYAEPAEIEDRLAQFGLVKADFFPVIEQVVAARADTIPIDAAGAAGQKAYLAGVRHSRLMLMSKGYIPDSTGRIESSLHPETGVKIVYQNVDLACSKAKGPQAISGKGPAADRMIEKAQGFLFQLDDIPEAINSKVLNNAVWFLCVAVNGESVTAELSLPVSIENQNFGRFVERIFLVKSGEWDPTKVAPLPSANDDYELVISRKE